MTEPNSADLHRQIKEQCTTLNEACEIVTRVGQRMGENDAQKALNLIRQVLGYQFTEVANNQLDGNSEATNRLRRMQVEIELVHDTLTIFHENATNGYRFINDPINGFRAYDVDIKTRLEQALAHAEGALSAVTNTD